MFQILKKKMRIFKVNGFVFFIGEHDRPSMPEEPSVQESDKENQLIKVTKPTLE